MKAKTYKKIYNYDFNAGQIFYLITNKGDSSKLEQQTKEMKTTPHCVTASLLSPYPFHSPTYKSVKELHLPLGLYGKKIKQSQNFEY